MYDVKTLQTAFQSLVGVRQSNIPGVPSLSGWITQSDTGIYVDDKHPLASTENMYYSSPNFSPSVYPLWVSGSNYPTIGTPTNYNGVIYISLNPLTNDIVAPPSDTTNWSLYNPFQAWLQQKVNQAVPNALDQVVIRKKLTHTAKSVIERMQLYRGVGSVFQKIIPQGRFVGFAITPQQAEGLWCLIDMIGIQLSQSQQSMPFYLYHSDSLNPIGFWNINVATANTFVWSPLLTGSPLPWMSGGNYPTVGTVVSVGSLYYKSLNALVNDTVSPTTDTVNWVSVPEPSANCILKYLAQNTSGTYFFGYYEVDLQGGAQALSKTWNCNGMPCTGCDGVDVSLYNQWSRYTTFVNIQVPSDGLDLVGRTIFDTSKISQGEVTNWGMNFSLTVRCNLTDYLIYLSKSGLLAPVLASQICKEFLEAIANGIRIGPTPAQTKLSAIAALDEKAPGNWITRKGGYYDSIDSLNLDLSGFSTACMSCDDNKKKIGFFSM